MSTATTTAPRRMLRTSEAAAYIGLSSSTLNKMRIRGEGPPWVRVGARAVAYDIAELDAYLDAMPVRRSTSEPAE